MSTIKGNEEAIRFCKSIADKLSKPRSMSGDSASTCLETAIGEQVLHLHVQCTLKNCLSRSCLTGSNAAGRLFDPRSFQNLRERLLLCEDVLHVCCQLVFDQLAVDAVRPNNFSRIVWPNSGQPRRQPFRDRGSTSASPTTEDRIPKAHLDALVSYPGSGS